MKKRILGIGGSLRSKSFNSALLRAAGTCLGPEVEFTIANIGAVPHYDAELDHKPKPASVQLLIDEVKAADGLMIATPEYNYSIPGVLKNAIDWVSRPAYQSALMSKPTAILGASRSLVGTARAQSHLRVILASTVTSVFPHPDVLVGHAHTKFDENGKLIDEATREQLQRFVDDFLRWL